MTDSRRPSLTTLLVCGGLIVTVTMGIRHPFGFFLIPMTAEFGWGREVFAFAMGLNNLLWGISQPIVGMYADRVGARPVAMIGALLYASGLALMVWSSTGLILSLSIGVLIGLALSCASFTVVYGLVARNFPVERRSQALGIIAAAGSFGQFFMVPVTQSMIGAVGWQTTAMLLAVLALGVVGLAAPLAEPQLAHEKTRGGQSAGQAMREALATPSYLLLTAGYFVCGFQVVFIGVHLPSYLKDHGMAPGVAVVALALIGLFNIAGTYLAGHYGARYTKKYLLAAIYLGRSVATVLFLLAPLTEWSVYLFAAATGFLWLSTVPLTNGIVAHLFGVRYMSMLGGFVFLSHQVGSFLGAWLGGFVYDRNGSYDLVWGISIALGVFAALVNWPIRERPVARLAAA